MYTKVDLIQKKWKALEELVEECSCWGLQFLAQILLWLLSLDYHVLKSELEARFHYQKCPPNFSASKKLFHQYSVKVPLQHCSAVFTLVCYVPTAETT